MFRIAPHRLGLQESKLSTRRICQRILCSQSLYEACEILVAASPSSPPQPNQSSSASGALQQQGPEKEDSDNWCFDRQPINKATRLPIRYFTKKLYFVPSRDENKTEDLVALPATTHLVYPFLVVDARNRQSHVIQMHQLLMWVFHCETHPRLSATQSVETVKNMCHFRTLLNKCIHP